MKALRSGAVIAILAGLIIGILLGTAGPAYPAHQAQAYCLDLHVSIEDEMVRRPSGLDCRQIILEDWSDSWHDFAPEDDETDYI